jgi:hypothetical protein
VSATLLVVLLASLVLIGASVAAMAIGVMFRRPCLRGSCGGPEVRMVSGEKISCVTCPNRHRPAAASDERAARPSDEAGA